MTWIRNRWFELVVLVALVLAAVMIHTWRQDQFEGYGLQATFYDSTDLIGNVLTSRVDPAVDFSKENDPMFVRYGRFGALWTGTIVIPRDGYYTFAVESDDGSWLKIDGREVINNGGTHPLKQVQQTLELEAGPHALELRYFQAGGDGSIRMQWIPFNRHGGLEQIPPTLLFPVQPDAVNESRAHPIPPRDLPASLLLIGALVLVGLLLGRRAVLGWLRALRRQTGARVDLVLFVLLFVVALGIRSWDLSAAGQTWDEDVYWVTGRAFVQNLLGADFRTVAWAQNIEHPPVAKLLYGAATLVSDSFEPARMLGVSLGALTCALLFLVGRDLVGRRAGFIGAAFCLVMPHIIGHHKIIGLETPSGLLYTLGVWLFIRGIRRGGNSGYYLAAGLVGGLVVATRLGNLSLFLVFLLIYLLVHWREILNEHRFPLPITLGLLPVVAMLTFLAVWPYLWENPLQHLGAMLAYWEPDIYLEIFLGERREPPMYYFPLYFAVTMPAAALVALVVGLVRAAHRRDLGHLGLLIWFFVPFVIIFSPMARDGVRYLFTALIPACLLVALGIEWLGVGLARLIRRPGQVAPAVAVLATAMGLYLLHSSSRVHPYYIDYYNEIVGGPRRVAQNRWFEIAWWGEGIQEATDYLSRTAERGTRVLVDAQPRHVVKLRPDLIKVEDKNADFVLFNLLFNNPFNLPNYQPAYVVRVDGAPMVWVLQREVLESP